MLRLTDPDSESEATARALARTFAERMGSFVVGELYSYSDSTYLLVFTEPESPSRDMAIVVLGQTTPDPPFPIQVSAMESAQFSVLALEDVNSDALLDLVFCHVQSDQPQVVAAIRTQASWQLEVLEHRPACGRGQI